MAEEPLTFKIYNLLSRYKWFTAAISSGLLYCLSIPKFNLSILAFLALTPLAYFAPKLDSRTSWKMGWLAGIVAAIGRTYWITETLQLYGHLPLSLAIFTNGLLILYIGMYTGFFAWLYRELYSNSLIYPVIGASLWILLEWVQSWMISGFPWFLIGYTQFQNLAFAQNASIVGIYGLSFLVVAISIYLARAINNQISMRFILSAISLIILSHAWLIINIQSTEKTDTQSLKVGVVQGNISQDRKWNGDQLTWTTNHYVSLTRELAESNPDLIVHPETALPYYFNDSTYAHYSKKIRNLVREIQIPLLVGSLQGSGNKSNPIYNRAFMLDKAGDTNGYADKVHLVPFGEYLPFPAFFGYLDELTAQSGQFTPGLKHNVLSVPESTGRAGIFICYESIFPEITRGLVLDGANFLINTTNDAWFGQTAAPEQHFAMSVIRAIETRRSVVRTANTGISGIIDPTGQIINSTELEETAVFTKRIGLRSDKTFYVRHGNWILVLSAIAVAIHIFFRLKKLTPL
ncbi:MAG: apolipoprotein N-acyltransferase [Candidatus Latescibacterota bacterium]|nr:apolipoprotein N-acyltransferase [Candidatus Latescibacterota bacterium]